MPQETIKKSYTAYTVNMQSVDPASIPEVADLGDLDAQRIIVVKAYPYVLDRYSTTIRPSAWLARLGNYLKNPIVSFAHSISSWNAEPSEQLPVGRSVRVWVRDVGDPEPGLWAAIQFAQHDFAEDVYQAYKGGFMNAVSVECATYNWEYQGKDFPNQEGATYTDVELIDISCVPAPGNQEALAVTRSLLEKAPATIKQAWEKLEQRSGRKMSQTNLEELRGIHEKMSEALKTCQDAHQDLVAFTTRMEGDDPDAADDGQDKADRKLPESILPESLATLFNRVEETARKIEEIYPGLSRMGLSGIENAPATASEPIPAVLGRNPIDEWISRL